MDPLVLAALARWPNVPDVYGWLALTARGQWRLRGAPIGHPALRAFIDRNYASDARGCWFFQNGPQRVFVALELTPWLLHRDGRGGWITHTGAAVTQLRAACWLDDGRIVLDTDRGAGLVDGQDLGALADAVDEHTVVPARLGLGGPVCRWQRLAAAQLPAHCGFVAEPRP